MDGAVLLMVVCELADGTLSRGALFGDVLARGEATLAGESVATDWLLELLAAEEDGGGAGAGD